MDYFQQYCVERNIKKETIKSHKTTLNHYTSYYGMTIDELIDEAINEEVEMIDKRKRSIKTRWLQFRTHLISETSLKTSTIQNHMKNLKALYRHFDIEIPNLPPMKSTDTIETTYYDLPTKKQIRMAVEIAGIRVGSLILFMASSGTGRTECANMTIQDFLDACSEYYTSESLKDILEELEGCLEPVVPTFYLLRQKTNKRYYTFCTPECTNAIIEWLQLRLQLADENEEIISLDDSLWDLTPRQINYYFSSVNDQLNLGFKGSYRFLRPHTLRKFHASNIGLHQDHIDLLEGRGRNKIHETYIKTNPEELKKVYMGVMDNLIITHEKKEINHNDFTININIMLMGSDYGISI